MPARVNTLLLYCPACGRSLTIPASLLGKRAKCTCGQSLLLPSTPDGHPQVVSATSSRAIPYHAPPPGSTFDAARPALRQVIVYCSILLVLLAAMLLVRHLRQSGAVPAVTAAPARGEDALVTQMLTDPGGTEAREWLAAYKGRMFSGLTDSQARARVEQWYKMGAVQVYAFGPSVTDYVAIELPADAAKRKALLEWTNTWNAQSHVKAVPDAGQKYALVRLRP